MGDGPEAISPWAAGKSGMSRLNMKRYRRNYFAMAMGVAAALWRLAYYWRGVACR